MASCESPRARLLSSCPFWGCSPQLFPPLGSGGPRARIFCLQTPPHLGPPPRRRSRRPPSHPSHTRSSLRVAATGPSEVPHSPYTPAPLAHDLSATTLT